MNINPCLFKYMVHAYEQLVAAGVKTDPAAVEAFETSYRFETRLGHAHLMTAGWRKLVAKQTYRVGSDRPAA